MSHLITSVQFSCCHCFILHQHSAHLPLNSKKLGNNQPQLFLWLSHPALSPPEIPEKGSLFGKMNYHKLVWASRTRCASGELPGVESTCHKQIVLWHQTNSIPLALSRFSFFPFTFTRTTNCFCLAKLRHRGQILTKSWQEPKHYTRTTRPVCLSLLLTSHLRFQQSEGHYSKKTPTNSTNEACDLRLGSPEMKWR